MNNVINSTAPTVNVSSLHLQLLPPPDKFIPHQHFSVTPFFGVLCSKFVDGSKKRMIPIPSLRIINCNFSFLSLVTFCAKFGHAIKGSCATLPHCSFIRGDVALLIESKGSRVEVEGHVGKEGGNLRRSRGTAR